MIHLKKISIVNLFVVIFAILFGFQFIYLADGNVLNHYPYISPDGYDWYAEGVYLVKAFSSQQQLTLPILRPPIFVLITALDFLLMEKGIVIALVGSLSIYLTYYFCFKIISLINGITYKSTWYTLPLAIGTTLYPLNFAKPYLLPDSLAVMLSVAALYFIAKFDNKNMGIQLFIAILLGAIASLTQTYGAIPILIFCVYKILTLSINSYKLRLQYIFAIAIIAALHLLVIWIWRSNIPHLDTPNNFNLIEFNFNMRYFYLNTWSYFLLPFILIFVFVGQFKFCSLSKLLKIFPILLICLFYLIMCFFYQWQESRFTYLLWPWLMIFVFLFIKPKGESLKFIFAALMLLPIGWVPTNYWVPKMNELNWRPLDNWISIFYLNRPVNRNFTAEQFKDPASPEIVQKYGSYISKSLNIYFLSLKN